MLAVAGGCSIFERFAPVDGRAPTRTLFVMKQVKLSVENREAVGRGPVRRLRAAGRIPAVIYGPSGNRPLSIAEPEFRMFMRKAAGTAALIQVSDDKGATTLSVLQHVDRDPVTDRFTHVDFHEVAANKPMTAHIPVHVEGTAYGVKNEDGLIEVQHHAIDVQCLPKDLPEFIEVDVTGLHAGEAIHVGDLSAIEGVTFLWEPDVVIVSCVGASTGAAKAVAADDAAEEEPGEAEAAEGEEGAGEVEKEES
jgi:large subunit ribosomal protein L25